MTVKEQIVSIADKHAEANIVVHSTLVDALIMVRDHVVIAMGAIPDDIANVEVVRAIININSTDIELFT